MLAYHRFLGFALLLPATTASSSLRPLYCLLGSAAYGADGAADVAGSKPCKGFQVPGCTWLPVLLLSASHCWRACRRSSFLVRARAAPPTGCTTHVQPSCGLGGRALLRCWYRSGAVCRTPQDITKQAVWTATHRGTQAGISSHTTFKLPRDSFLR